MAEKKETRINGRAVSRGIAVGPVTFLYGNRRQFFRRAITKNEITTEQERVERAREAARNSIGSAIETHYKTSNNSTASIFESQLLILDDPALQKSVAHAIANERVNAEAAILQSFEEYSIRLRSNSDARFAEIVLDLEDVAERWLSGLGTAENTPLVSPDSIVVAKEIFPSSLVEIASSGAVGLIAESGGWTSHTSILAREAKLPAVTGISQLAGKFRNGQMVIVNGYTGEVILDPDDAVIESFMGAGSRAGSSSNPSTRAGARLSTLDGREITIRTNATDSEQYRFAQSRGAQGIGLYRSESLIGKFKRLPDEAEQLNAYSDLAGAVGEFGIRIRTFDIDADQFSETPSARQKNPALGVRAIRLALTNPELLYTQIRALLRSAANVQNVDIIVPMVTSVSELESVRIVVEEQSKRLRSENVAIGMPGLGAMIEIPSAVMLADQLAEASDFLCLGTNDLAQYLLAADRDNESVSEWFRTLHPAMLRAVKHVIEVCRKANKPLIVCGEMAGSPFYAPVLIGLGAAELSMNPGSIDAVWNVVSGIAYEEASELVRILEKLSTADEVEAQVERWAQEKWPHLFAPGFLERHGR